MLVCFGVCRCVHRRPCMLCLSMSVLLASVFVWVCVVLCMLVRSCDVINPITSSGKFGMLSMNCS